MLSDLGFFIGKCVEHAGAFVLQGASGYARTFQAGDLYCPGCGAPRRMVIWPRSRIQSATGGAGGLNLADTSINAIAAQLAPAVFTLRCVQDDTAFTALVFGGPEGYELAIFPMRRGGLATEHSPDGVAFYLDQAQRAQSTGANSAAVAMYRAALEHLLFEQGYTVRMLGPKLEALTKDIKNSTAKKWALDLNPAYLTVVNKLAAGAIHPGDGDVSTQAAFDREILTQLQVTMSELVQVVYEREHEEKSRLEALEAAAKVFEK
jgi:hypothetical protein